LKHNTARLASAYRADRIATNPALKKSGSLKVIR
jgi:hypothetical protein